MSHRVVSVALIALLVIVHAQLWFGRGSMAAVAHLTDQLAAQKQQNKQAQVANNRLAAEVRDLKEGLEMIEEKARLELGMIKPNEIYVQFAPSPKTPGGP